MSKFSGLAKNVKDLLQKPFSYDNKVELKTKASNGVSFTGEGSIGDSGAAAKAKFDGKHGDFSVDKLEFGTDKKVTGEFKLANQFKDTDLSFKFTDGSRAAGAETTAVVGAEFNCPLKLAGRVTLDVDVLNGPNFDLTFLRNFKGFLIGGSGTVGTSFLGGKAADKKASGPVSFSKLNALLGYKAEDYTVYAQAAVPCTGVDVGFLHSSGKLSTGLLASLPCAGGKPTKVLFGGSYKVDGDSTAFATVDEGAKVSLGYKQKLSAVATASVSGQVDALNLASDVHKFGITLSLTN